MSGRRSQFDARSHRPPAALIRPVTLFQFPETLRLTDIFCGFDLTYFWDLFSFIINYLFLSSLLFLSQPGKSGLLQNFHTSSCEPWFINLCITISFVTHNYCSRFILDICARKAAEVQLLRLFLLPIDHKIP